MATPHTAPAMQLCAELRQMRLRAGMNTFQAADAIRCQPHTWRRYERGDTTIPRLELEKFLEVCGWQSDDDEFKLMVELRSQAGQPAWWSEFNLTDSMNRLVGFEATARIIKVYEPCFVFGPLQTEAYAREIIRGIDGPGTKDDVVEKELRLRMERQKRIYKVANPPALQVILNEAVIRSEVGGPAVMAEQLEFLAGPSAHCDLRILPLGIGAHVGMSGAFWLFDFPSKLRRPSVYMEGPLRNLYLDDEKSVDTANVAFDRLWDSALDRADSRGMLLDVLEEVRERQCDQTTPA